MELISNYWQTGLFSAVLTAFNVESYKSLAQDSSDTSAAALLQISHQLASLRSNATVPDTLEQAYTIPKFIPSSPAVLINILWFSSLVLSLISASLGMLVKQWLREYLTAEYTSPKERIRLRYYKYRQGLIKWRVFEIAALPQLLLQLSLILFFTGLSVFLLQLHPIVGLFVTALIIIWFVLLAISTVAPIFSFGCPYKNPLSKSVFKTAKSVIFRLQRRERPLLPREYAVRRSKRLDIRAIIQADEFANDDDFLESTIRKCLKNTESSNSGADAVEFIQKMLEHRLDYDVSGALPTESSIKFHRLATKALSTSIHIALDQIEDRLQEQRRSRDERRLRGDPPSTVTLAAQPWMKWALSYVFSALDYSCKHKRQIGEARGRGLRFLPMLLVEDESLVRECLRLSSLHWNIPLYIEHVVFPEKCESSSIPCYAMLINPLVLLLR